MSDEPIEGATGTSRRARHGVDNGNLIGGVVIVAIGVLLLAAQTMDDVGQYIPLLVGAALLFGFLLTRHYGFLVPGGIITGVGVGILLVAQDQTGTRGPLFLVSLGLGFVSIWLLGMIFRVRENHWWPLIPGGILIVIGAVSFAGPELQQYLDYWPIILVIFGAVLIGQALMRRRPA